MSAIGDGSKRSELVRALVSLGTTLGLVVVAEEIEEAAQLEYLLSIGCELGQGYYFAKPLEADRLEMLLPQANFREPIRALAAVS